MATDGNLRHLASERIQDFLDQALPPKEEALVRLHLSDCSRCRSEVEGWRLVYEELSALPDLEPGPAFSDGVLARLGNREPAGSAVLEWRAGRRAGVSSGAHIPEERLQDYVEGVLSGRRAAGARAHLAACEPCRAEQGLWERVFGALAGLDRFAPAPGFAVRVMAKVRVPVPVPVIWAGAGNRVWAWARGFLPRSRRGWAIAGGIASAPTISMAALLYLVFSHPLLSLGTFTTYASWKASALFASITSFLGSAVVESVAVFRAYSLLGAMARSPLMVGMGGLAFSVLSALALWVLYRNLLATPSVESRYVRARV